VIIYVDHKQFNIHVAIKKTISPHRYAECDTQPIDEDHSLPYGRSSSWNIEQSQAREEDLEDGELEDGEIDDPGGDIAPPITFIPPVKIEKKEERPVHRKLFCIL
jgi:hypothetical protein